MAAKPERPGFGYFLGVTAMAFIFALILRAFGARSLPVNGAEAELFVGALDIASKTGTGTSANPAWLGLTAPLFYLFPATALLGRFWPLLLGASLTIIPFVWREKLSFRGYALLSLLLAIDPLLVRSSVDAAYPMITFAAMAWALTAWQKNWPKVLGFFSGLALLAGAWGITLLIICVMAWLLLRLVAPGKFENFLSRNTAQSQEMVKKALPTFLLTLVLIGTVFFLYPQGIAGIGAGFAQFLRLRPVGIGAQARILVLVRLAYAWPWILLSLPSLIFAYRRQLAWSIWSATVAVLALLLSFVFPSLGALQVIFVLAMIFASVPYLEETLSSILPDKYALGLAGFTLVISAYVVMQVHNLGWQNRYSELTWPSLIGGAAGLLLIFLAVSLVTIGWGKTAGRSGLRLAVITLVPILILASSFTLLGQSGSTRTLFFTSDAVIDPQDNFAEFLNFFEHVSPMDRQNIRVKNQTEIQAPINWIFRGYQKAGNSSNPQIVITGLEDRIELPLAYNSTDLMINRRIRLDPGLPPLLQLRDLLIGRVYFDDLRVKVWVQPNLILGNEP